LHYFEKNQLTVKLSGVVDLSVDEVVSGSGLEISGHFSIEDQAAVRREQLTAAGSGSAGPMAPELKRQIVVYNNNNNNNNKKIIIITATSTKITTTNTTTTATTTITTTITAAKTGTTLTRVQ
jgi:hypothetical protein